MSNYSFRQKSHTHKNLNHSRNNNLIILLTLFSLTITYCTSQPSSENESLLNLTAIPTRTISPYPTATYFFNPTALTASSIPPTPTQDFLGELPIEGSACIPKSNILQVKVSQVIDGDTIEVDIGGNLMLLRYIGIEAPKPNQDGTPSEYSAEATARNAELVGGKEVLLIQDLQPSDGYGFLLGYIISGNIFVNYQLVREGYARAVPYQPNIACKSVFSRAETLAKNENLGIWSK